MPVPPTQRDLFGRHAVARMPLTRPLPIAPAERCRRALLRRGWMLAAGAGLCCAAGLVGSHWVTPVYRATASVEWQAPAPAVDFPAPTPPAAAPAPSDESELQTLAEELGSRALTGRVARAIGPGIEIHRWRFGLFTPAAPAAGAALTPLQRERLVAAAQRQLQVIPVAHSRVLHLQFEAPTPELAVAFLHRLSGAYLEQAGERQRRRSLDRVRTLAARVRWERGQVALAQNQLARFTARHGLADPGTAMAVATSTRQQLTSAATRAHIASVHDHDLLAANAGNDAAAPVQIAAERAKLAARISRLNSIYLPQAAPLAAARRELAGLDHSLAAWHREVRADAVRALAAERREAHDLSAALAEQARSQRELGRELAQFDAIQSRVQARENTYAGLLDRLEQAAAAAGPGPAGLRVSDPASAPPRPLRPRLLSTLASCSLAGLLLGIVTIWSLERWHDTAVLPEAGEMGAPLLAVLPRVTDLIPASVPSPNQASPPGSTERTATWRAGLKPLPFRAGSPLAASVSLQDAIEPLAASLMLEQGEAGTQVILLTGCGPGDGATTLACQLARVLAAPLGAEPRRVLLLDAAGVAPNDARRSPGPGLHALLAGRATVDAVLRRWELNRSSGSEPSPHAAVAWIPFGASEPDSSYALNLAAGSGQELLRAARQRYDWILIDGGVFDAGPAAAIWASLSDRVLLAAAHGRTSLRRLRASMDRIETVSAGRAGLVLNFAPRVRRASGFAWVPSPPRPENAAWRQRA